MVSEAVNVRSIKAIEDVHTALLQLREDMQEAVVAAKLATEAERIWVSERKAHWQRRVTSLAEELIEAEAALARCRDSRRSAGSDGCRSIADWAKRTRKALWEAEGELRNVRHWERVLDEQIASIDQRVGVLTRELAGRVPAATAELIKLTELLHGYAGR